MGLLHALQAWLTRLPHRSDYCSRLLPYAVAMLTDDLGEVGGLAWQVLCAAGEQYARDEAVLLQVCGTWWLLRFPTR